MGNKKGVVLIVSIMILTVLLVLTTAFFSRVLTERRSVDSDKFVYQALSLAEAGVNHGLADLKKRIRIDLKSRVENSGSASTFASYVSNDDALGFIRDFAYASGETQFSCEGSQALLIVSSPTFNSGISGSYTTTITLSRSSTPTNPSANVYVFSYNYSIESTGVVTEITPAITKKVTLSGGNFSITVRRDNFAKFALFTSHHMTPSGVTVWFTEDTNFTGPVSTNDRLSFANNPSAHFTEEVTQHQKKARFYNDGWTELLDADYNGTKDVPVFDQSFQRGYEQINLESSLQQTDLRDEALGSMSEPGTSGVYVPNNGGAVTGGIYIRGDSSVALGVESGTGNAVYTIVQGSTTNTITVDYTNNQTTVQSGATTNTYTGIPDGVSDEGVLIYSKNDITSFSGTVQKQSNMTVASEKDVVITGNVKYEEYDSSPTLNADNYDNLLGIISWGQDVRIGSSAPDNVEIHGVIMAPHGVFTVDDYKLGSPRGTATLLGGVITEFYGPFGTFSGASAVSGYGRNFVYDARMLQGKVPPYFPYMSNFSSFEDGGLDRQMVWTDEGV